MYTCKACCSIYSQIGPTKNVKHRLSLCTLERPHKNQFYTHTEAQKHTHILTEEVFQKHNIEIFTNFGGHNIKDFRCGICEKLIDNKLLEVVQKLLQTGMECKVSQSFIATIVSVDSQIKVSIYDKIYRPSNMLCICVMFHTYGQTYIHLTHPELSTAVKQNR